MKVRDVIRDLDEDVKVQIYKPSPGGYEACFLRAYSAGMLRGHSDDRPWIRVKMDKVVDHCEFGTISRGAGFAAFCDIYLKAESAVAETECELDAFFKKLDPDAYVYLYVWYGDPKDDAGEFIRVSLCGADYAHIKNTYKSINDLLDSLEIVSISTNHSDKAIALDCKRRIK